MHKKGKFHHNDYDFVHQANGDFRTVEIKEMDGRKVFIKHYHLLTPAQVKAIYDKYVFFYERIPQETVRTPEPLSLTDCSITFAFIDLPEENRLNHFLVSDEVTKEAALKRTAENLHILHIVGEEKNYNHGDCGYGNFFLYNEYMCVIDFESPPNIQKKMYSDSILYSKEFDLALFNYSLFSLSDRVINGYIANNTKYHDSFLVAYQAAGGNVNDQRYKKAMWFLLRDTFMSIVKCQRTVWYKVPFHLPLLIIMILRNKHMRQAVFSR